MNPSYNPAESFRHEAGDLLVQIEESVLAVGADQNSSEEVNRLFRAFHTIKGSGAMFGFTAIAEFTHHIETMLDSVRTGSVPLSAPMVAQILAARDHIAALLHSSPDEPPPAGGDAIITACHALIAGPSGIALAAPVSTAPEPDSCCVQDFRIHFRPNANLLAAGTDPRNLFEELRGLGECTIRADISGLPPLEQLHPDSCYLRWEIELRTDRGEAAIRDVFIFVEDGADLRIETTPADTPVSTRPEPAAAQPALAPKPEPRDSRQAPQSAAKSSPVRVASERLDQLVGLVGELVMTHSRIAQIANRSGIDSLDAPVEDLERIVGAIRDAVLGIRMTPIGATFSRFKRLVHDLSSELGKEIELAISGEETELDKTVLDQLGDPLVHLVRNSIDHGIEPPAERLGKGKPARARIGLHAAHTGANVVVSISDDGRGLDLAAIRAKAIERHLVAPDVQLSDSEITELIFLPGFSTAPKLTSVSGRGVGMDVVRRQIEALRGSIRVSTDFGKGTTIALSLPLTLAIIEGQLVEIGGDQFIIPMAAVAENVEFEPGQQFRNNGRNVTAVRGDLVSYIRLRDLFEIRHPAPDLEKIVIVHHDGQRLGLVVDRVLGSHQTVIQSLGRFYRGVEAASGATIMGDGRVALILDIAGLVRSTHNQPTIEAAGAA